MLLTRMWWWMWLSDTNGFCREQWYIGGAGWFDGGGRWSMFRYDGSRGKEPLGRSKECHIRRTNVFLVLVSQFHHRGRRVNHRCRATTATMDGRLLLLLLLPDSVTQIGQMMMRGGENIITFMDASYFVQTSRRGQFIIPGHI